MFVNSGSEATGVAVLLARLYTGNYDMIGLRNGYHGMTLGAMATTALSNWRYNLAQAPGFLHAMNPDVYRGIWNENEPDVGAKYAGDVQDIIMHSTSRKVAGFIAETIQGVGGTVELAPGYLKHVYKHVSDAGGLCIADEVQTGFGRTGTNFWGFQNQGVLPDIVTMAKGIGNGVPLAAVATTDEIAKTVAQKLYFNTYGGNPVSMAVGRAVLRVLDEEKIQDKALHNGKYLKDKLLQLQKKHNIIGHVRGQGLMLGVELVKDRKTKEPAPAECAQVFETAKDSGLLIGKGGLYGNVLRIKPPMCITKADIDFTAEVLDQAFAKL